MSYFVANSISIKKDGSITIIGCDNNVYPKTPYNFDFKGDKYKLLQELCGRNIQPKITANNYKWAYVINTFKTILEQDGDTLNDAYKILSENKEPMKIEFYKTLFDSILEKAQSINKEKYLLKHGMYFVGDNVGGNKRWYLVENREDAQVFKGCKAMYYARTRNLNLIPL